MINPEISVCIITYNQKKYIRQCIESALLQEPGVAMEILIGDDGSDDGGSAVIAEIAAAHSHMIKHIRNEPRLGGCENYKFVMSQARGKFIAHLDGDDYWLPGKLKLQYAFMQSNSDCVAVYTNALTVNEAGVRIGLFNDIGTRFFDLAELLRKGNFLNSSSLMIRSELRSKILDIQGQFIDYRVHLRHARLGRLAQLGDPLVGYRVNSVGSAVAGANDLVRRLYWEAIIDVPRTLVTDSDFAYGLADFLRRVLFRSLRLQRYDLLREWSPLVFKASPFGQLLGPPF